MRLLCFILRMLTREQLLSHRGLWPILITSFGVNDVKSTLRFYDYVRLSDHVIHVSRTHIAY